MRITNLLLSTALGAQQLDLTRSKICQETNEPSGFLEDDLSKNLIGNGDSCIYKIKSDKRDSNSRIKLRLFETLEADCEEDDHIFVVADGHSYGPFCHGDSHDRHRRAHHEGFGFVAPQTTKRTTTRRTTTRRPTTTRRTTTKRPKSPPKTTKAPEPEHTTAPVMTINAGHQHVTLPSSNGESHDTEGTFNADEVDIVYVTSPTGYKFRFKFQFEWELVSYPMNYTVAYVEGSPYDGPSPYDEYGIPRDPTAMCTVGDYAKPSLAIFNELVESYNESSGRYRRAHHEGFGVVHTTKRTTTRRPTTTRRTTTRRPTTTRPPKITTLHPDVVSQPDVTTEPDVTGEPEVIEIEDTEYSSKYLEMLTMSIATFADNFDKYSDACKPEALDIPCELYRYESSVSPQEILGTMGAVLNHIKENCEENFGWQWFEIYTHVSNAVGGTIPDVIIPNVSELETDGNSFTIPITFTVTVTPAPTQGADNQTPEAEEEDEEEELTTTAVPEFATTTVIPDGPTAILPAHDTHFDINGCPAFWTKDNMTPVSTAGLNTDGLGSGPQCELQYLSSCFIPEWDRALARPGSAQRGIAIGLDADQLERELVREIERGLDNTVDRFLTDEERKIEEDRLLGTGGKHSCHMMPLLIKFRKVVNEISDIAKTGHGEFTCKYSIHLMSCDMMNFYDISDATEFMDKLQILADSVFDTCGKSGLSAKLQPEIDELKRLAADDCQDYAPKPASTLPPTVAPENVAATKVPYTTMYDGLCATKSFTHKTVAIFQGRAFDIVDRDNALRQFTDIAGQINQLGKKLLRSRGKCNLEAGKLPCHMLAFPKNTMACDLAGRIAKIVDYIGTKCDTTWNQIWGQKVRELVRDSMPDDGATCSSDPIDSQSVRELNVMFLETEGLHFNNHVKDQTMAGNAEYKQWMLEQKQAAKEQKQAEKEKLAAERAERRAIMAERRRDKLVRQQQQAREAYEKALELLRKQEANLLHKTEVIQMEIGEEENEQAVMMNDVFGFSHQEESEEEEFEMEVAQCPIPSPAEYSYLARSALDKLNNLVVELMEINDGTSSDTEELAERLSFRYSEVIDFILNTDRAQRCPNTRQMSCYNMEVVFGEEEPISIGSLVAHASQIIIELESSCPQILFSTMYVHGGESDDFFEL